MKNYFTSFLLLLPIMVTLSSCRETSKLPEPANVSVPLIIPEINPQKSFFDYTNSRSSENAVAAAGIARPVFEFVVNPSRGYAEIQTVEVYKSFRRGTNLGPRVKVMNLGEFPATISINSQDALTGLFLSSPISGQPAPIAVKAATPSNPNRLIPPPVNNKDAIVFTFEYVMKDGRRVILTPLSTIEGFVGAPIANTFINPPYAAIAEFR
ncbi:hypothetical protein [Hymenobacter terrenus]|uniref:hypothetical protein n=1 Tax=Hymenobacter terrenus TaxID=1629124 RepID=UPI0006199016|nr:hypothetical protein [Hymenobacter terrenus]